MMNTHKGISNENRMAMHHKGCGLVTGKEVCYVNYYLFRWFLVDFKHIQNSVNSKSGHGCFDTAFTSKCIYVAISKVPLNYPKCQTSHILALRSQAGHESLSTAANSSDYKIYFLLERCFFFYLLNMSELKSAQSSAECPFFLPKEFDGSTLPAIWSATNYKSCFWQVLNCPLEVKNWH